MDTLILLAAEEGVKPVKSVGNIFFYVFLAALVVAVVTICLIFTQSKAFKTHMRESIKEKSDVYNPPRLVKVYDEKVKEDIKEKIERELRLQEEEIENSSKEVKKYDNIQEFSFDDNEIETKKDIKNEEL